ncbi:hypothetical protein GALMADRAFT_155321 [Galerina marginata CBS 339.88]|uniref:FAD dependent oxidoreductase domain-containing protein n=1 Tax=Galerina marginata (strain CBS 339.88) TaxID=685588 RepID=A0A067TER3_GALM3|nr:hypothetical protein GALMADRAFT_155321 [Galerina marginata CBS 339.88]
MGAVFSTLRLALQTLKALIDDYETLSKRISLSPGIPQLNSSVPYWTIPPSSIANHGQDAELPQYADVVIIGSGITGTSIAKAMLERSSNELKIVMLEARDACSGATGRNGGHASPLIYNEYFELKKTHGAATALQILRFRLAHITTLIDVAKEENLLSESQARLVEDFDAYLRPELFSKAKKDLDNFVKEVPKEISDSFAVIEERNAIETLQLATSIVGLIVKPGASIHAYRFVTGILSNLLDRYSNFQLYTRTPCTAIATDNGLYIATTPRGRVRTQHVIHATNAWTSHLLPGLRRKIVPVRAHMSAQRPGQGLSLAKSSNSMSEPTTSWTGSRAFVFYPSSLETAYEYLTQLLPSPISASSVTPTSATTCNSAGSSTDTLTSQSTPSSLPTAGEFMFGGGAMLGGQSEAALMNAIGVSDDGGSDFVVESYLGGSLERYFSGHWGQEGNDPDTEAGKPPGGEWGKGRAKAFWTGLVALSADMQPWVGRVPPSISGRPEPKPLSMQNKGPLEGKFKFGTDELTLSPAGEWVCAGYSGEGMVHAWLSGRAVARMVLDITEKDVGSPELPSPFFITEKRVKQAKIEHLMERAGH